MAGIESIKYSLRNMKHRKSRNFLTIFSIFVGIATIFIFVSFGYGLYNYIEEITGDSSVDKVIVMSKGIGAAGLDQTFKLTSDDVDAVKKAGGVYKATGSYFISSQITYRNENVFTLLFGYDVKEPFVMEVFEINIIKGRELRTGDKKSVVLGYNYLIKDKIFKNSIEINSKLEINGEEFKVVGFYDEIGNPQDDAQVYMSADYLKDLYLDENISYGWIIAKVDTSKMNLVIENIEKNLRKERGLDKGKEDFFVQSFENMMNSYASVLNIVIGFILLIALISVLVSAVNTANAMITSVLERYKEIGILKAIGSKNFEIFSIFLFESAFLGLIAGIIGVGLGAGLSYLGGVILYNLGWGFLQPYFSIWLFAGLIGFAIFTGAISGAIPAYKASKTNIVDALRYE